MKKILIFGAGAIGRGYLPWIFSTKQFEIHYVESDKELYSSLCSAKEFSTFMTKKDGYDEKNIKIDKVYAFDDINSNIIASYDYLITCVGPRQFLKLTDLFLNSDTPIICLENDRDLVSKMRTVTGRSDIYFGIPDVISSNTASEAQLNSKKLSLITESGVCFVESECSELGGDIIYVDEDEIARQWAAKLYIHNTPHCIAAYLGSLAGCKFLHEAMKIPLINTIVRGAAMEMRDTCILKLGVDEEFADFYFEKEISRFENTLLFDPISRIAREPFRKLALDNRLIGATALCLSAGVKPSNIAMGTIAAFHYNNPNDEDHHIRTLIKSLSKEDFLQIAIGLHENDVVYQLILENWERSREKIERLSNVTS